MPRRNKNIRQNTVTGEPFDYQISVKLYKDTEHAVWKQAAADRKISLNEFIRVTMRKECEGKPPEECKHMKILSTLRDEDTLGQSYTGYICKLCGEKL